MDDMPAELAAEVAANERRAETIREIQKEMAGITGTAESDDGLISATTGVRGQLQSLELDPRIYRKPDSTALAAEITKTVRAAAEEAGSMAFAATVKLLSDGATQDGTDLAFGPLLHELDGRP